MHSAGNSSSRFEGLLFAALLMTATAQSAELMAPAQQNALTQKYCAVCHTDAAKNGGLSLEHYDAAYANPPLAAMLLSKLTNGAMGAAGLGIPDKATREAWVAATAAQAERANEWTVIRTDATESKAPLLVASIVRYVAARKPEAGTPIYRLILACNIASHQGEIQLAWSPEAQTNRTFSVSPDGRHGIPQQLEGREEQMGNGSAGIAGLAAAALNAPLPEKTLHDHRSVSRGDNRVSGWRSGSGRAAAVRCLSSEWLAEIVTLDLRYVTGYCSG